MIKKTYKLFGRWYLTSVVTYCSVQLGNWCFAKSTKIHSCVGIKPNVQYETF